jgi:hypothetical protein
MKLRTQLLVLVSTMLIAIVGAPTQAQAAVAMMPCIDTCTTSGTACESSLRTQGLWVAGYACNTYVSSLTYYKGWGNIRSAGPCSTRLRVYAWRWNGSWTRTYLDANTRVYIWPFATDWSWVWTQSTGWLAARDVNLVVNKWENPASFTVLCMPAPGYSYAD